MYFKKEHWAEGSPNWGKNKLEKKPDSCSDIPVACLAKYTFGDSNISDLVNSVLKGVAEEELSESIELAAINTDARSFNGLSPTIKTLQIGKDITNGYGTGGHWEIGDLSARQDKTLLQDLLHDTDMLFITAGFGGGAGSGIAPVLAQLAKEQDILTAM